MDTGQSNRQVGKLGFAFRMFGSLHFSTNTVVRSKSR